MALIEHGLVVYQVQLNSFEQYRHYCECKCGWQCRLATEEAAKSQFDAHMIQHGKPKHFANIKTEEKKEEVFDPFGKK
jgi:hypothetical protein